MFTICTNEECKQKFKIKPEMVGMRARCKKCQNVFGVEEYKEPPKIIDLEIPEEESEEDSVDGQEKKRRSPREVMEERIAQIKNSVLEITPKLRVSLESQENESDTRLLLDFMLQNVLEYKIEDIKTEQKIEGRRADYVLSVRGRDVIIVEVKRIGMPLKARQIFQATSYGAYAGIKWVVLTNAVVWQLYHISTGEKIETDLVFTIDLRDGLDDQEAEYFYLISKHGISRKGLLDNLWRKISALCYENIVSAILTDDVIAKIRSTLSKQTGYKATNEEVRETIENNIFQLG